MRRRVLLYIFCLSILSFGSPVFAQNQPQTLSHYFEMFSQGATPDPHSEQTKQLFSLYLTSLPDGSKASPTKVETAFRIINENPHLEKALLGGASFAIETLRYEKSEFFDQIRKRLRAVMAEYYTLEYNVGLWKEIGKEETNRIWLEAIAVADQNAKIETIEGIQKWMKSDRANNRQLWLDGLMQVFAKDIAKQKGGENSVNLAKKALYEIAHTHLLANPDIEKKYASTDGKGKAEILQTCVEDASREYFEEHKIEEFSTDGLEDRIHKEQLLETLDTKSKSLKVVETKTEKLRLRQLSLFESPFRGALSTAEYGGDCSTDTYFEKGLENRYLYFSLMNPHTKQSFGQFTVVLGEATNDKGQQEKIAYIDKVNGIPKVEYIEPSLEILRQKFEKLGYKLATTEGHLHLGGLSNHTVTYSYIRQQLKTYTQSTELLTDYKPAEEKVTFHNEWSNAESSPKVRVILPSKKEFSVEHKQPSAWKQSVQVASVQEVVNETLSLWEKSLGRPDEISMKKEYFRFAQAIFRNESMRSIVDHSVVQKNVETVFVESPKLYRLAFETMALYKFYDSFESLVDKDAKLLKAFAQMYQNVSQSTFSSVLLKAFLTETSMFDRAITEKIENQKSKSINQIYNGSSLMNYDHLFFKKLFGNAEFRYYIQNQDIPSHAKRDKFFFVFKPDMPTSFFQDMKPTIENLHSYIDVIEVFDINIEKEGKKDFRWTLLQKINTLETSYSSEVDKTVFVDALYRVYEHAIEKGSKQECINIMVEILSFEMLNPLYEKGVEFDLVDNIERASKNKSVGSEESFKFLDRYAENNQEQIKNALEKFGTNTNKTEMARYLLDRGYISTQEVKDMHKSWDAQSGKGLDNVEHQYGAGSINGILTENEIVELYEKALNIDGRVIAGVEVDYRWFSSDQVRVDHKDSHRFHTLYSDLNAKVLEPLQTKAVNGPISVIDVMKAFDVDLSYSLKQAADNLARNDMDIRRYNQVVAEEYTRLESIIYRIRDRMVYQVHSYRAEALMILIHEHKKNPSPEKYEMIEKVYEKMENESRQIREYKYENNHTFHHGSSDHRSNIKSNWMYDQNKSIESFIRRYAASNAYESAHVLGIRSKSVFERMVESETEYRGLFDGTKISENDSTGALIDVDEKQRVASQKSQPSERNQKDKLGYTSNNETSESNNGEQSQDMIPVEPKDKKASNSLLEAQKVFEKEYFRLSKYEDAIKSKSGMYVLDPPKGVDIQAVWDWFEGVDKISTSKELKSEALLVDLAFDVDVAKEYIQHRLKIVEALEKFYSQIEPVLQRKNIKVSVDFIKLSPAIVFDFSAVGKYYEQEIKDFKIDVNDIKVIVPLLEEFTIIDKKRTLGNYKSSGVEHINIQFSSFVDALLGGGSTILHEIKHHSDGVQGYKTGNPLLSIRSNRSDRDYRGDYEKYSFTELTGWLINLYVHMENFNEQRGAYKRLNMFLGDLDAKIIQLEKFIDSRDGLFSLELNEKIDSLKEVYKNSDYFVSHRQLVLYEGNKSSYSPKWFLEIPIYTQDYHIFDSLEYPEYSKIKDGKLVDLTSQEIRENGNLKGDFNKEIFSKKGFYSGSQVSYILPLLHRTLYGMKELQRVITDSGILKNKDLLLESAVGSDRMKRFLGVSWGRNKVRKKIVALFAEIDGVVKKSMPSNWDYVTRMPIETNVADIDRNTEEKYKETSEKETKDKKSGGRSGYLGMGPLGVLMDWFDQKSETEPKPEALENQSEKKDVVQEKAEKKDKTGKGLLFLGGRFVDAVDDLLNKQSEKDAVEEKADKKHENEKGTLQRELDRISLMYYNLVDAGKGRVWYAQLKNPETFKGVVEYFKANDWQISEFDKQTLQKFVRKQQKLSERTKNQSYKITSLTLFTELVNALSQENTGKNLNEQFKEFQENQAKVRTNPQWFEKKLGIAGRPVAEGGKFLLALLFSATLDALTDPTIGLEELVHVVTHSPEHLLGLATFSAGAGVASTLSKKIGDAVYRNSIEAIQFQLRKSVIRGATASRTASMTVGIRSYVRTQIGFVVGSLLNGFIFQREVFEKDPDAFWQAQFRSIGSFMVASAIVKGSIYTVAKIAEVFALVRTGTAAAAVSPPGLILQAVILGLEIWLAPKLEKIYEKSALQAKLEPMLMEPYRDYIAVLNGDKKRTSDCHEGSEAEVLACLQKKLIVAFQTNWQQLSLFAINKKYVEYHEEYEEWKKDEDRAKYIFSSDFMMDEIDDALDTVWTPTVLPSISSYNRVKSLYTYDQKALSQSGYKAMRNINRYANVIIPPSEEGESGDGLEKIKFERAVEYMKELNDFNRDFVGGMNSMYQDFYENMNDDPKTQQRYSQIQDIQAQLDSSVKTCLKKDIEDQAACFTSSDQKYRADIVELIFDQEAQLTGTQERIWNVKRKGSPIAMAKFFGAETYGLEQIESFFNVTWSHRANPAEMLDLLFQMAQGILVIKNKDESIADMQEQTVMALLMLYEEMIEDAKEHAYSKAPYIFHDLLDETVMFDGFVPYGYDFEQQEFKANDFLHWMQMTSRKYAMIMVDDSDQKYLYENLFARVMVDHLWLHGKIGMGSVGRGEEFEKIRTGLQTFMLLELGVEVVDLTPLFDIAGVVGENTLRVLIEVADKYKQRDAGYNVFSNYPCEYAQERIHDNATNPDFEMPGIEDQSQWCSKSGSVGIQLFYQVLTQDQKDQPIEKTDSAYERWAKVYETPIGQPLAAPMGQVFIHKEMLNEMMP